MKLFAGIHLIISLQFELIEEIENLSEEPPAVYTKLLDVKDWEFMRTSPLISEKKRRLYMYGFTNYLLQQQA